ncbi:acyl-CoA dehydrogenase family protein [Nocardioides sp. AE5]|uniref:acyl-CoA dehydrogenase family protein n=1 Tax=Nocardioides sp. AE5 TaxID=2962573 RepID=UPI00288122D3|nr:acyl-CoA dehydrogenase family protein [Nocardioides sp. AE5]MDT0202625.1 acyl-CoA dehydrogenase family protein [Nocardioides sp. AE5]
MDWIDTFVREKVQPLDYLLGSQWNIHDPEFERLVRPLQAEVKARGLWACHLGPELGGPGFGQLKLALMNEKFGMSRFGPIVFGAQAPDTGNAEILAQFGTPEQKRKYLDPLLANEVVSCFSMTEPQGGADPLAFETSAVQDGDDWVINGEKWFASEADVAGFIIMMVVTDPEASSPYERASMFIIDRGTPGVENIRNYGFYGEPEDTHAHLRLRDVRVPATQMLGRRGQAFAIAQTRLGGGRMHHAMRTLAQATTAFEMLCERVVSRSTKGEVLAHKQMVQEKIADLWVQLRQFRLLVLETAWLADQGNDWKALRLNVSAVKTVMPRVLNDVASTALHLHGSLGITHDVPFAEWVINSFHVGLADGPTEVHKVVVAREVLKDVQEETNMFPSYLRHVRTDQAKALYGVDEIGVQ